MINVHIEKPSEANWTKNGNQVNINTKYHTVISLSDRSDKALLQVNIIFKILDK